MKDLKYDKTTGKLYKDETEIGYKTNLEGRTQYLRTGYKGKQYAVHRLIWEMHFGKIPKGKIIDHIDGNGMNNRLENLRLCTYRQNAFNRRLSLNNTSGYKGVVESETNQGKLCEKPWRVRMECNGKTYSKRGFKTAKEAAIHYNEKAKELFGEYAFLNKV